jgi:hypothetical protein
MEKWTDLIFPFFASEYIYKGERKKDLPYQMLLLLVGGLIIQEKKNPHRIGEIPPVDAGWRSLPCVVLGGQKQIDKVTMILLLYRSSDSAGLGCPSSAHSHRGDLSRCFLFFGCCCCQS